MSRILAVAVLLVIIVAATFSIRFALADAAFRTQTPEGVSRALRILPDRVNYVLLRALQMDYDGEDSTTILERAARTNLVSSAPRIRLGLAAETRGDFQKAETWLLDAARVDRQFEPRWTLANFYFRRERPDEFWMWMRSALEVSYGNRRLAFDLCWRMTQDPNEILTRAIPPLHDVLATYLYYVLDRHQDAIGPVALKLAAWHNPADVPPLEVACDELLNLGNSGAALELWTRLGHPHTALITNGDFAEAPSGHGFDWRPAQSPGVAYLQVAGAYRIVLSGQQPESAELLRQIVVLEPGKTYSLRWELRTQGLGSPTGIAWSAGASRGVGETSEDWHVGAFEFKARNAVIPITLGYQRPIGQARTEGWLELRKVSLVEK